MRAIAALGIAFALLGTACGGGGSDDGAGGGGTETSEGRSGGEASRSSAQGKVGDRLTTPSGNTIQVFTYEQPVPGDDVFEPTHGNEYSAIDVEACAGSHDQPDRSVNPFWFELQMPDNTRRDADVGVKKPALNDTALPFAGDCVRGWVTFEVPKGQRPAYVIFTFSEVPMRWEI